MVKGEPALMAAVAPEDVLGIAAWVVEYHNL
jgi:hypothetical protein